MVEGDGNPAEVGVWISIEVRPKREEAKKSQGQFT